MDDDWGTLVVLVAIQPAYGNPDTRERWHDTMDREVDFLDPARKHLLSEPELARLRAVHPSGSARFWGGTDYRTKLLGELSLGDVVVFTGGKHIRGVGEVGFQTHNAQFGGSLWKPDKDNGVFANVYSVVGFQPEHIPYQFIWDLDGFNAGDNFMGLRILRDERADTLLSALRFQPSRQGEAELAVMRGLLEQVTGSRRRLESDLVARFRAEHGDDDFGRLRTRVGPTDLYLDGPDGAEIIEAKSSAGHDDVRLAAGQLIDYAYHACRPVARLSALFPTAPSDSDRGFLHWHGIDCVYFTETQGFRREEAPAGRRAAMVPVWNPRSG